GLLATATVLTQLLEQGPTPQRVVAALPALVLVMASFAARGLLDAAVGAVQAVLAPRVELRAQDELHAAVIAAELVAFDDADFMELVRRTSAQGINECPPRGGRCGQPAQLDDFARRRDRHRGPAQPRARRQPALRAQFLPRHADQLPNSSPPPPPPDRALQRVPSDPEVIELQEVSFSYPGKDEPALDRVSLTIKRGQVVALVGENGSGKSTLAKVITGLYLPDQGRVTWDGVDIAQVDQRELHSQVAAVLQNPVEWPMTAANNIRIGRLERPDTDGNMLAAAAADSGTDAVVAELPNGWDTVLSRNFQNGHDLSGGQWQRISVARGLYRDAPLLVADEPTAAMDARAEHAVFQSLQSLTRAGAAVSNGDRQGVTRTTVLITHRLANIRHADQIIVMDHGRITEQGTHGELMARGGGYAELFTLQAQAYLGGADELSGLG
ncbi:MAG TPA: ATP-binding cassette domain-containing protein, partial [Pseudonocardiaceae bacterium]|nr:ATP-binding cassette domain-containing protein [Pseudonocardiaceae bacterium]